MSIRDSIHASEAARRLGVTPKALRLYETHGLMAPGRSGKGYRLYDAADLARAAEIVALRRLDLPFRAIASVLDAAPAEREAALEAHRAALQRRARTLAHDIAAITIRRRETVEAPALAFDLPWPWGGERFIWPALARITFLTGPLGSGKTRLARAIAEAIDGAVFLGLDRTDEIGTALARHADAAAIVVDLVEHGLDAPAQRTLMETLRRRPTGAAPLVLMTRSTAILDLAELRADEDVLYCPANHTPPMGVVPAFGAVGYEALATCLASPDVRARTAGMRAVMSAVA